MVVETAVRFDLTLDMYITDAKSSNYIYGGHQLSSTSSNENILCGLVI